MEEISLLRLFFIFLKIGSTSFGGNVALVAAVRKELSERKKIISDEQILDFTTIGNILPGPLATNVIAAVGFAIRGIAGAIVGLLGILLPALVLICVLADFYFKYGESHWLKIVFTGLIPGVAAIICATAWSLIKKNISNVLQIVILLGAGLAILVFQGFLITLLIVVVTGIFGFLFFKNTTNEKTILNQISNSKSNAPLFNVAFLFFVGLIIFLCHPSPLLIQELRMLALTFGSISVTLFGGGYVFIPAIEKIVVGTHHWVSSKEFADGIALGQVTPGPVAITAAFVGYKVSGIWGAIVSTLAIFIPPASLMLVAQQFIDKIKGRSSVEAIFKGVRPAVIGMILASIWVIGKSAPQDWQSLLIFGIVLFLSIWKNIDTAILIPISGLLGWLLCLF